MRSSAPAHRRRSGAHPLLHGDSVNPPIGRATRGECRAARLHHRGSPGGKRPGVLRLLAEPIGGRPLAVGLEDAPGDADWLAAMDLAVIVPGVSGRVGADLAHGLPGARVAPAPAPDGWAAALAGIAVEFGWPPRAPAHGS
jgi:hypothetical protein